jgi:hypothetical protein
MPSSKLFKMSVKFDVWMSELPVRASEQDVIVMRILEGETFGEFYPETTASLLWCLNNEENRERGFFGDHEAIRAYCASIRRRIAAERDAVRPDNPGVVR